MPRQILNLGTPTRGLNQPGAESRYSCFNKIDGMMGELYGPLVQPVVTSGTLPITAADHMGADITLAAANTGVSYDAGVQGDEFTFTLRNRSGSDWTVSGITNATLEFEEGGTKVASGKSASFTTYTRSGTRYVAIIGATV